MHNLTHIMIALCVFAATSIGLLLSISINNECEDTSMNHSLGYLLALNSAIFAMTMTFFMMSNGMSQRKFSKEALASMALLLGGVSLWLSISIVSAANSDKCKANTKGWILVVLSGVIVLGSGYALVRSFRKTKS